VLATGSNQTNFKTRTDPHPELFAQFRVATYADNISEEKPSAEISLTPMKKLEIETPENCLDFKDASLI
jgi:beta-phosphoglucomutase-like phosphatase (HAD superfamily)